MNRPLIKNDEDFENYMKTRESGINKPFLDRVKDLEDYVRTKKNGMKICFHCVKVEDFKMNIELVELFQKEINIKNLIAIGYKGFLYVKRLDDVEYNKYKSFVYDYNINDEFNDLIQYYCNSAPVNLAGCGSSEIITTLILYYTKIYFKIPYSEKDEEKSKGAKWDVNKKKWYIYYTNENLTYFIEKYKITDETYKYIDEYIKTKTTTL